MNEELDVSEVVEAVDQLCKGYRKPLRRSGRALTEADHLKQHEPPPKSDLSTREGGK